MRKLTPNEVSALRGKLGSTVSTAPSAALIAVYDAGFSSPDSSEYELQAGYLCACAAATQRGHIDGESMVQILADSAVEDGISVNDSIIWRIFLNADTPCILDAFAFAARKLIRDGHQIDIRELNADVLAWFSPDRTVAKKWISSLNEHYSRIKANRINA